MSNRFSTLKWIMAGTLLVSGAFALPQTVLHAHKMGNFQHGGATDIVKDMLDEMGAENGFVVSHVTQQSGLANIGDFDVVLFDNTGQNSYNDATIRTTIQQYIEGGGLAIGLHASSDHHGYWDWWNFDLHSGCEFVSHGNDPFVLDTDPEISNLPGMEAMWADMELGDNTGIPNTEIYVLDEYPRGREGVTILQTVNPANATGDDHIFSWHKQIGDGQYIYNSLGHSAADFSTGWVRDAIFGYLGYLTGDYDVPVPVVGCMDATAENHDPAATEACTDCCTYAACCGTAGYEEYVATCQNHQDPQCITVGVSKSELENAFVTLNPEMLSVTFANPYAVQIINVSGETVLAETNKGSHDYSFADYQPGFYFVNVTAAGKSVSKKVFVK